MAINVELRMRKIRKLRTSSSATRKEYLVLAAQIKELQSKAAVLRESYRGERARATKLLESLQKECDHENRSVLHDKEKPWVLYEICRVCKKEFPLDTAQEAESEAAVEVQAEPVKVEVVVPEPEAKKSDVPDPRVPAVKELLPELLLHSWTADATFKAFVHRAWHQFDNSIDFYEFQAIALSALNVSQFALHTRGELTVRQFLAIYYKQVNDRMWDRAPNERCLRELRSMLGIHVKRCVDVVVKQRDLTKKHDWKTVK